MGWTMSAFVDSAYLCVFDSLIMYISFYLHFPSQHWPFKPSSFRTAAFIYDILQEIILKVHHSAP